MLLHVHCMHVLPLKRINGELTKRTLSVKPPSRIDGGG